MDNTILFLGLYITTLFSVGVWFVKQERDVIDRGSLTLTQLARLQHTTSITVRGMVRGRAEASSVVGEEAVAVEVVEEGQDRGVVEVAGGSWELWIR